MLCMAFADVSDENKAFVGSISIVHVVLSAGLLTYLQGAWHCVAFCANMQNYVSSLALPLRARSLLSSIGGTVCKNLRSYYTLDSVLNCYNFFLVEFYKTSF